MEKDKREDYVKAVANFTKHNLEWGQPMGGPSIPISVIMDSLKNYDKDQLRFIADYEIKKFLYNRYANIYKKKGNSDAEV